MQAMSEEAYGNKMRSQTWEECCKLQEDYEEIIKDCSFLVTHCSKWLTEEEKANLVKIIKSKK